MTARSSRGRVAASALALAAIAAISAPSMGADPPPPEVRRERYSDYERQTLDVALAQLGATIDPSAEGKIIEGVDIVRLPVFEKRDPLELVTGEIGHSGPMSMTDVANFFHVTSRDPMIRREVVQRPGERYRQFFCDETARNLAKISQLSLVLCVPVRGSAPDRVRLLVIAKDTWSLRLNSDFRFQGGKLERLLIQPSETNIAGLHQTILATFDLLPDRYSLGGRYVIARIADSWVRLDVSASVILNRAEGKPEGSFGSFYYAQPLYTSRTAWAWGAQITWRHEVTRRIVGGEIATYDAVATPDVDDKIPFQYKTDQLDGAYDVTRSFGLLHKHDVTVGVGAVRNVYRPFDLSDFPKEARDEFLQTALPVSDTQIGPYAIYRDYSNRFLSVLDLDTLGLQENYRRGHDVSLKLSPILKAFNSTRNFFLIDAAGSYALPIGDGLARAAVRARNELTTSGVPNGSIEVTARVASPRFLLGRFIADGRLLHRYANDLNAQTDLGGDTRLRGYPSRWFRGKDVVSANLEFRSRPLVLRAVQLAGAAFFDVGDAFDGFQNLHLKYAAGAGARVLFPQLERVVIRVDLGFPLRFAPITDARELPLVQRGGFPGDVVVTFGQAFQVIPTGG